jgi:magnesium-protoporphyrin O-methyltransferase
MKGVASSPALAGPPRWEDTRARLTDYFDRTAFEAWAALTSDAPVSKIRATVRAGRDQMRSTLLSWLPEDLSGRRILDAGCGTGALAVEAARRGAEVVGIDVSPQLISIACERAPPEVRGRVQFLSGDMLDAQLGDFDHVVSMDVLIHYRTEQIAAAIAGLAARTRHSIVFTFAPGTPLLRTARVVGRLFPQNDRAPTIIPVGKRALHKRLAAELPAARLGRDTRVSRGFYTSQAQEVLLG